MFLAMEYIPLGDLEHNVSKLSGRLPETEGQIIAGQILEGLEIMHAEGFAHRDLKPQVQSLALSLSYLSSQIDRTFWLSTAHRNGGSRYAIWALASS